MILFTVKLFTEVSRPPEKKLVNAFSVSISVSLCQDVVSTILLHTTKPVTI